MALALRATAPDVPINPPPHADPGRPQPPRHIWPEPVTGARLSATDWSLYWLLVNLARDRRRWTLPSDRALATHLELTDHNRQPAPVRVDKACRALHAAGLVEIRQHAPGRSLRLLQADSICLAGLAPNRLILSAEV